MPKRSLCWTFFEKLSSKESKCKLCSETLQTQSSTSSMNRHLTTRHAIQYQLEFDRRNPKKRIKQTDDTPSMSTSGEAAGGVDLTQEDQTQIPSTSTKGIPTPYHQPAISDAIEQLIPFGVHSTRKQELDRLVLDMCIYDMQPLSLVENRGFRALIYSLDPRYKIISRNTLTQTLLPKVYNEKKTSLVEQLQTIDDIAITTDQWTSRANDGFTTVTAHYLKEDWTLASPVLMTRASGLRHTGENLAAELEEVFQEYHIKEKIITATTDNAKNAKKSVRITETDHQPCFAHTTNLVVRHALEDDDCTSKIKKVKDIASFFHSSNTAKAALQNLHQSNSTQFRKIKNDVVTRWNSTYTMLESYLFQHKEVTAVLCLQGRQDLTVADDECRSLQTTMAILRPFFVATEEMSAEKFTSISKIIPIVRLLKAKCRKERSTLAQHLLQYMDLYFGNVESRQLLRMSTYLDPRFKDIAFEKKEMAENAMREVQAAISEATDDQPLRSATPSPPPQKKSNDLWDDFDAEAAAEPEGNQHTLSAPDAEMKHYKEAARLDRKIDPLQCWKKNEILMPNLSKVARKYLIVPATSVPAERVFSKAGELVSARRSRLKKSNVDKMLFLNKA